VRVSIIVFAAVAAAVMAAALFFWRPLFVAGDIAQDAPDAATVAEDPLLTEIRIIDSARGPDAAAPDAYLHFLAARLSAINIHEPAVRRNRISDALDTFASARKDLSSSAGLPRWATALRLEASASFSTGAIADAVRTLDVAIAKAQSDDRALMQLYLDRHAVAAAALENDVAAAYLLLAARLQKQVDREAALANLKLAVNLNLDASDTEETSGFLYEAADISREALEFAVEIASSKPDAERELFLAPYHLLYGESHVRLASHRMSADLERAEASLRAAVAALPRESAPEEWADAHFHLGNALTFPQRQNEARLREAIALYQAAGSVWTYGEQRWKWGVLQNRIGGAQRILGENGDVAALRDAVGSLRRALTVKTREFAPGAFAAAQNELGYTLRLLSLYGDKGAGAEAVAARRAALEVITPEQYPDGFAFTQVGLAEALMFLGEAGDEEALRAAAAALRSAMTIWTEENEPMRWAGLQTILGFVLSARHGVLGDDALEEAIAANRAVQAAFSRDQWSYYWASAEMGIGAALLAKGLRGDAASFADAETALRTAIDLIEADKAPDMWARAQHELGVTLAAADADAEALRQSLHAFDAALSVRTRDRRPFEWALTKMERGTALLRLSQAGEKETPNLAANAFQDALEVFSPDGFPLDWADTHSRLAEALLLGGDAAAAERSLRSSYRLYQRLQRKEEADRTAARMLAYGINPHQLAEGERASTK